MIGKILVTAALAFAFFKGGKKKSTGGGEVDTGNGGDASTTQGYRIVGCGDVEIVDEAAAFAWARAQAKGRTVTELVALLGGGCAVSAALISKVSPAKALFVWNLARHGLAGYVEGGGSKTIANLALSGIRSQAVAAGVVVAGWPEGLPPAEPTKPGPKPAPQPTGLEVIDHGRVPGTGVFEVKHTSIGTGGPIVWVLDNNVPDHKFVPRDVPLELYGIRLISLWPDLVLPNPSKDPDGTKREAAFKNFTLRLGTIGVDLQTLQAVLNKGDPRPWFVVARLSNAPFALQLATATNIDKTDNRAPDVVLVADPVGYPTSVPGFPLFPDKAFSRLEVMVSGGGVHEEAKAIAEFFAAAGYPTNYITLENSDWPASDTYLEAKLRQLLALYA